MRPLPLLALFLLAGCGGATLDDNTQQPIINQTVPTPQPGSVMIENQAGGNGADNGANQSNGSKGAPGNGGASGGSGGGSGGGG